MKNVRKTIGIFIVCAGIGGLSPLSAQENETPSTAELLEEGVYLQEAEGNLDKAIEVYRSIVEQDEASRAYAAEAQFRLATCLLKQGEKLKATEAFEALIAKFPDQEKWSDAALEYMPAEFTPLPAPWVENERTILKWVMNGNEVGQSFMTISSLEREERDLWMVDHQVHMSGRRHTRVEFDKETAITAYSHWNMGSTMGIINSWYSEDEVRVEANGGDEPKIHPISETVYDNEQVAMLFRQMPLEVGYSEQIYLFIPLTGQVLPLEVRVNKTETVDTGIGAFECYRIDMPMIRQSIWLTADENRYLAKLQAGEISAILDSVSIIDSSKTKPVANEDIGFGYDIPQDWETRISSTSSKAEQVRVYVLDPDFEADFRVFGRILEEETDRSDAGYMELAEQSIETFEKELKNFEIDEGSLRIEETGIGKTVVFTGKHTLKEKPQILRFNGFLEPNKKMLLSIRHPDGERNEEFNRVYDVVLNSMSID